MKPVCLTVVLKPGNTRKKGNHRPTCPINIIKKNLNNKPVNGIPQKDFHHHQVDFFPEMQGWFSKCNKPHTLA